MAEVSFHSLQMSTPPKLHRCERGWSWSPPPLKDFDLWYVMEGLGEVKIQNKKIPISAGHCFVFQPDALIKATHDPKRPLLVFAVHFNLFNLEHQKLTSLESLPIQGQTVRNTSFFSSLAKKCEESFLRKTNLGIQQSHLALQQMLLQLIEEWETPAPLKSDIQIQKITADIQSHPAVWQDIDTLAQKSHLSRSQFVRRFYSTTGFSPNDFMIQNRIDRACRLLEETNMNIKQIAEALNYKDIFFFSKQFKKIKGYPPRFHNAKK